MRIEKKPNYTLLISEETTFSEFYTLFLKAEKKIKKEHIVLQISQNLNSTEKDFFVFLQHAQQRKEIGISFVIISSKLDIDTFPETFNIVPTLIEAEDILAMEAIEKELGF